MKKNRTMRVSALLLALTLITSCFVGGTFAKYTSRANDTVKARVANWGFAPSRMVLDDLFSVSYQNSADVVSVYNSIDGGYTNLVAPGTTGSVDFAFKYDDYDGAATPEVAYTFTVDTTGSEIGQDLKLALDWYLDGTYVGNFDKLQEAIKALSGDESGTKVYAPGELPEAFADDTTKHTITWVWDYEHPDGPQSAIGLSKDISDTFTGNAYDLDEVTLAITITATQID